MTEFRRVLFRSTLGFMQTANKLPLQFDAIIDAPFGAVGFLTHGEQVSIELLTEKHALKTAENRTVQTMAKQISAYFNHVKHDFKPPVNQHGTPFQQRVWQAISAIPCGQVLTYGQLAAQIGSGPRAVANACGANNLPLDRKSTRLNSSHERLSRMPSSA